MEWAGSDIANINRATNTRERIRYAPGLVTLRSCGQRISGHHIGHGIKELKAGFSDLKRSLQVENGSTVLNSNDPSSREAPTVTYPIDFVKHRYGWVTRAQKICVQRVHRAIRLNSAGRCYQRLPGDLTAEDSLAVLVWRHAPKDVDLNYFEIKKLHQCINVILHVPILLRYRP